MYHSTRYVRHAIASTLNFIRGSYKPVDELSVVPHQLLRFSMLLMISEDGVLADEMTSAPVGHMQLTSSTSSNVPDQNKLWLGPTAIGSASI